MIDISYPMQSFLRLATGAALIGGALAQGLPSPTLILINEIRIDQPSADNDEYFELLGSPPGATLDGLTYLVIGDGTGGSGVIEAVIPLDGQVLGANGLFLAAETTFTFPVPFYNAGSLLNFENSDNVTHLLVNGFTGALNDDLDTDDDGVLDTTPWTTVRNAISLVADPLGGDRFYGSTLGGVDIGPDGAFVPSHVYRCLTSITDVRIGDFTLGAFDTPGAFNTPCVVGTSSFCNPSGPNSFDPNGGVMSRTGTGSLSVNDNSLVCSNVPNFFGVFVQASGAGAPITSPIGGQFCVNANIVRLNQIVAPVNNVATLALDFSDPLLAEFGTLVGSTVYYQFFHRDTLFSGGGNWSNGLAITWAN